MMRFSCIYHLVLEFECECALVTLSYCWLSSFSHSFDVEHSSLLLIIINSTPLHAARFPLRKMEGFFHTWHNNKLLTQQASITIGVAHTKLISSWVERSKREFPISAWLLQREFFISQSRAATRRFVRACEAIERVKVAKFIRSLELFLFQASCKLLLWFFSMLFDGVLCMSSKWN